jgi:hypothetical protein
MCVRCAAGSVTLGTFEQILELFDTLVRNAMVVRARLRGVVGLTLFGQRGTHPFDALVGTKADALVQVDVSTYDLSMLGSVGKRTHRLR